MLGALMVLCLSPIGQGAHVPNLTPAEVEARQQKMTNGEFDTTPTPFRFARQQAKENIPGWLKLEKDWNYGAKCGPNALYILMDLAGFKKSLEEVTNLVPIDPNRGSSLSSLAEAAEKLGFPVQARQVSATDLAKLSPPYMIHITQGETASALGHYMVVFAYKSNIDKFGIVDGNTGLQYYADSTRLLRSFDGYVLIPESSIDPLIVRACRAGMYGIAGLIFALMMYLTWLQSSTGRARGDRIEAGEVIR